ncbi:MAG: hypothetical protein ACKPH7_11045 [Planktothrix sp.]|uniref:hypothetical protein n=1 Tax=Planktothrix sp. TaxID=3088171 RepID=UPI0038D483EF
MTAYKDFERVVFQQDFSGNARCVYESRNSYNGPLTTLTASINPGNVSDCYQYFAQNLNYPAFTVDGLTEQEVQQVEALSLQYIDFIWQGLFPVITAIFCFTLILKICRVVFQT